MATTFGQRLTRLGPLALRVGLGLIMVSHGQQKVFGEAKEQFPGMVESLGVPDSDKIAKGVSYLEFFGGLALLAGLFTRVVAALFVGQFLFILFRMKFGKGLSGFEFDLSLLSGFLALVCLGGGAGSLDEVLFGGNDAQG